MNWNDFWLFIGIGLISLVIVIVGNLFVKDEL